MAENRFGGSPSEILAFGNDWKRKVEIGPGNHKFGKTFSLWSYTPQLRDHSAIYFGTDRNKKNYFFSKNGTNGQLVIQKFDELKKTYALWNQFRTDYKRG